MKQRDLFWLALSVEKITELTDASVPDIVDALVGIAWDEEVAGEIKDYHTDEEGI